MIKNKRFTFLCDDQERNQIYELAVILERTQGDAVRWAVRQVHKQLTVQQNTDQHKTVK